MLTITLSKGNQYQESKTQEIYAKSSPSKTTGLDTTDGSRIDDLHALGFGEVQKFFGVPFWNSFGN